jgi:hypothetical protein
MRDRGEAEAMSKRDRGEAWLGQGEAESMPMRDLGKAEAMRC